MKQTRARQLIPVKTEGNLSNNFVEDDEEGAEEEDPATTSKSSTENFVYRRCGLLSLDPIVHVFL